MNASLQLSSRKLFVFKWNACKSTNIYTFMVHHFDADYFTNAWSKSMLSQFYLLCVSRHLTFRPISTLFQLSFKKDFGFFIIKCWIHSIEITETFVFVSIPILANVLIVSIWKCVSASNFRYSFRRFDDDRPWEYCSCTSKNKNKWTFVESVANSSLLCSEHGIDHNHVVYFCF